ncbi:MAG: hypothetical protein ACLT8V_00570 [Streptococcus salivarius]
MPQQLSSIQMAFSLKDLSPFTYYVKAEETGKPRFSTKFLCHFWEISGNNQMARV